MDVYATDPVAVAEDFAARGARWIHVVDLSATFGEDAEALELTAGAGAEVATAFAITKAAALAYLMFNLFTPPCFAALGAMRSEINDRKWFWGGVGLQFATGYTVAFLVYQIGTLVTTGSFGPGFLPGLIAVAAIAAVIVSMIRKTDRQLAAQYALKQQAKAHAK